MLMNDDNDRSWEPPRPPDGDGPLGVPPAHTGDSSIWGVPALLSDIGEPATTQLAALILFLPRAEREEAARGIETSTGGEPIDPVATGYLRRGFGLVTSMDVAALCALPDPSGWTASLASASRTLRITDDRDSVITGPVDVLVPPNWYRSLTERACLVVLIASPLEPGDPVLASIEKTRLAGRLVGARVPLAARWSEAAR
jgi:hypothetical protein